MKDPAAEGLLYLLSHQPTLMPEAPEDWGTDAIAQRLEDGPHPCLRCGDRAELFFISTTTEGPRWLDLCPKCFDWLLKNID